MINGSTLYWCKKCWSFYEKGCKKHITQDAIYERRIIREIKRAIAVHEKFNE